MLAIPWQKNNNGVLYVRRTAIDWIGNRTSVFDGRAMLNNGSTSSENWLI